MDEQLVRQLVRQALARHLGGAPRAAAPASALPSLAAAPASATPSPGAAPALAAVPISFARFHLGRPAGETECVIEPSVTCDHCGHCQCYGH
jgi:hypothetical protein